MYSLFFRYISWYSSRILLGTSFLLVLMKYEFKISNELEMISIFSQIQQKGDAEEEMMIEYFLLLCSDVILEVLPISAHKIGASWRVFIN